ncbi:MAG: acetyl-CoA carboxylase biotin carboxyl carrier protein [Alphaproteobacteria bacterium]|nr:MAG: acetyl-CoA carboxylase biotin carboxyl carrier protein [Alphaproteobacteria bacterium]
MKKIDLEMEKAFIDYLVETMKERNLSSLEVTRTFEDEKRLKIKICNSNYFPAQKESIITSNYSPVSKEEFIVKNNPSNSTFSVNTIKSPMVGTVYLSPSPEEPAFIHVGKKINKGDTILIIEAMKTMNQIPSSIEGTVKEILVNNESPVEFDTPLVIIE